MKKMLSVISIAVCVFFFTTGMAISKEQVNCPVMGGKINKEIYADHDGKRVFFCCSMCSDPFKKDPEKYIKKMEAEGVVPAKIPEKSEK